MFGMSMTEIGLILALVLVVVGPEKIPDVARTIGKVIREVRKASNLLRDAVMIEESQIAKSSKSSATAYQPNVMLDPSPSRNVRQRTMSSRSKMGDDVKWETLKPTAANLSNEEIYLHIPYEETI